MKKSCKLCQSEDTNLLFRKKQLAFFKCPYCKLVFLGNTLNREQTEGLYSYYERTPHLFRPVNEKRYLSLLRKFEPFKKESRLLDVGCGRGHFVNLAQDKGWEAIGTEISKEAVQICKEKKLKVHWGDISEFDFKSNYFDIITMFEVIEHISNPEVALKQIYRLLRPGGLLYITTPNFNSLTRFILGSKWRVFSIEHTYYFTPVCIMGLSKKIGFSNIKLKSANLSIIEMKSNLFVHSDEVKEAQDKEQILRERIEDSRFLLLLKHLCNTFLNFFKLGDTLYIYAEK